MKPTKSKYGIAGRVISFLAIILMCLPNAYAVNLSDNSIQESLAKQHEDLASAQTLNDSITALFNIIDLSEAQGKKILPLQKDMLELMKRAQNIPGILDMARNISNNEKSTAEERAELLAYVKKLPKSPEVTEAIAFLNITDMRRNAIETSSYVSQEDLAELQRLADQYNSLKNSPQTNSESLYNRITLLFKLCTYLQLYAPGTLLHEHMEELGTLIRASNSQNIALESFYRNMLLNVDYDLGDYASLQIHVADFLDMVNRMEAQYHKQGRQFRSLDHYRYRAYRWLLGAYDNITAQTLKNAHDSVVVIAARNTISRKDFVKGGRATVYHYMLTGRYREAIPLIEKALHGSEELRHHERLLALMVEAARKINDKETLVSALDQYNSYLMAIIERKQAASEIEFKIINEGEEFSQKHAELLKQNELLNKDGSDSEMLLIAIASGLILIFVIWIAIAYWRRRKLSLSLRKATNELAAERDSLRQTHERIRQRREEANTAHIDKTEFLHDISYEILEPAKAIVGYAQLISDSQTNTENQSLYANISNTLNENLNELTATVNKITNNETDKLKNA